MLKQHLICVGIILASFLLPSMACAQTALTVDTTKTGAPFSRNMLGVGFGNWEFGWDKPMLGDPKYAPLAAAYKKGGISYLRYAGGNWNDGLAFDRQPMRDQGSFSYRGNTYYQNYGTDELQGLSSFAKASGTDVMIEANISRNDPGMWADMVKYTNIEKGYGFKYWELGNENEATWNGSYLTPDEYIKRFIEYEKAMKAVDPSIIVMGPTDSKPAGWSNGAGGLNRSITELPGKLKAANGRELGGLTWHWYVGYQDNTIRSVLRYAVPGAPADLGGENDHGRIWGDKAAIAIEQYAIKGAPILHGVSEINTLADNRVHIQQNHIAGLFLADTLPRLAANGVDLASIWLGYSQSGTGFGMVQHSGYANNLRLNSPYYVYYMLSNYFGNQMLSSSPLNNEKISIWASKDSNDPGKIKLLITNLSDTDIPATVTTSGFAPASGVYYELLPDGNIGSLDSSGDIDVYSKLNGKKLDIYNLDASIAAIQPSTLAITNTGFTRTFPRYSVTSVILSGAGGATAIPASPTSVSSSIPPSTTTAPGTTTAPTAIPSPTSSTASGTPTPTTAACFRKPQGDANCNGKVNLEDLEIWTREFLEDVSTSQADFNNAGSCKNKAGSPKTVCLDDLQIWTTTFLNGG